VTDARLAEDIRNAVLNFEKKMKKDMNTYFWMEAFDKWASPSGKVESKRRRGHVHIQES